MKTVEKKDRLYPPDCPEKVNLTLENLDRIYQNLQKHSLAWERWGERTSQDYHKTEFVQPLLDYAFAARCALDFIKVDALKKNVGQYNSETGVFELISK